MLTRDLSPSTHISEIAHKGHQRANAILRCFVSPYTALLVRAFVTYDVRPLLKYNCITWSPHLMADIHSIENVQRRFTKRLPGL